MVVAHQIPPYAGNPLSSDFAANRACLREGIPFQVILLPIEHAFVLIGGTCRHLGGSCKHGLKEGLRKHAENLKENQLLPLQWLNARSRTSLLGVDMSANLIEL